MHHEHGDTLPGKRAQRLHHGTADAGIEIVVARPLLERSPVLTDPDLIDVVRTSTMQHALAIAGRVTVSDTL
ncbi:MAG: DUF2336 domain-containing protein, partial [Burkholderiaceae bacterium]